MECLSGGFLIALEGIDGSGKSTLASNLGRLLQENGIPVLLTKEPGGTPLGVEVRRIVQGSPHAISPIAEAFLFAADRAQHIAQVIKPALANGQVVISDRMADSTRAYQGFGRGLDASFLELVIAGALDGVVPDLVLYLALDSKTALGRLASRSLRLSRFEKERPSFYDDVMRGFDTIFAQCPYAKKIDAGGSPDDIARQAYEQVLDALKKKNLV